MKFILLALLMVACGHKQEAPKQMAVVHKRSQEVVVKSSTDSLELRDLQVGAINIKTPPEKLDFDYSLIDVTEMHVETSDYPDFCDSYVMTAEYDGREMTEEEIAKLNEDGDFVYQQCIARVF